MDQDKDERWERALVWLLILWCLVLHGCAALSAGALWRDEANSIHQARLPTWTALGKSLGYDSFPALYPVVLRTWSQHLWTASDRGLRCFGLIIGVTLLASIVLVARILGAKWPVVTLVLLGANALLISEGDSIRPYGLSLLLLVWTYGLMGRALLHRSGRDLALAALGSILAVQAAYTNALLVAALCLCAVWAGWKSADRSGAWRLLIPGGLAALSLIPYAGVLQRASEWAPIAGTRMEWKPLLKELSRFQSTPLAFVWIGFVALALARLGRSPLSPIRFYKYGACLLGLWIQLLFMKTAGVPPFPRYLLPVAVLAAFAIEEAFQEWNRRLRLGVVIAALLMAAWPSWALLRQRHSNVDRVAEILAARAARQDLVIVSPWFLGTSFQRYYSGPCEWITIPELEREPLMRYDLVRRAMLAPQPEEGTTGRLLGVLRRGGALWFVSQRRWSNLARAAAPESPPMPSSAGGADYVRFRSYWEREIEYRLHACCAPSEAPLNMAGPVRDEEDLMLTRWQEKR